MKELLKKLKTNPDNPRYIDKEGMEKLKNSIYEFPEMLELRPIVYDENFVVLGGNSKLIALRAVIEQNDDFVLKESYLKQANNLTDVKKKEFIIKDNTEFGKWDWDRVANNWDDLPLDEWGLKVMAWEDEKATETEEEEENKIKSSNLRQVICPKCGYKFAI
jgi:hypothetical protein